MSEQNQNSMQAIAVDALENAKAKNIHMLDVRGMTDIADTMIVASGTSDRHVKALSGHLCDAMRENQHKPIGVEGEQDGDWILLDFGDLIVHLMREATREFYDLEGLWGEELRKIINANREVVAEQ